MSGRWGRYVPLTGVLFCTLLCCAVVIARGGPDSGDGGERMLSYYREHHGSAQLAAFLIAVSVVVAVFFYGFLSSYLRRDPANEQLASVVSGGGVISCVGTALLAGCLSALAVSVHDPDPSTMAALTAVEQNVGFVIHGIGSCALLLASGIAILRSGLLPRWTGWYAILFGVVAVLPTGAPLLLVGRFLAIGAWPLIVGVIAFARVLRDEQLLTTASRPSASCSGWEDPGQGGSGGSRGER